MKKKISTTPNSATILLHVQPGAKTTAFKGMFGERHKLSVAAPPSDGRANDEIIRFFSKVFSVSKSSVEITAGLASRDKSVRIEGVSPQRLVEVLKDNRSD